MCPSVSAAGGERTGMWNPAPEELVPWADCPILWLSARHDGANALHLYGVHAWSECTQTVHCFQLCVCEAKNLMLYSSGNPSTLANKVPFVRVEMTAVSLKRCYILMWGTAGIFLMIPSFLVTLRDPLKTSWSRTGRSRKMWRAATPGRSWRGFLICIATWSSTGTSKVSWCFRSCWGNTWDQTSSLKSRAWNCAIVFQVQTSSETLWVTWSWETSGPAGGCRPSVCQEQAWSRWPVPRTGWAQRWSAERVMAGRQTSGKTNLKSLYYIIQRMQHESDVKSNLSGTNVDEFLQTDFRKWCFFTSDLSRRSSELPHPNSFLHQHKHPLVLLPV